MIKALVGAVILKLILGVLWLALFVWALIDILAAKKEAGWKVIWVLICLIFPIFGVLGYYLIGRKAKNRAAAAAPQAPSQQGPSQTV